MVELKFQPIRGHCHDLLLEIDETLWCVILRHLGMGLCRRGPSYSTNFHFFTERKFQSRIFTWGARVCGRKQSDCDVPCHPNAELSLGKQKCKQKSRFVFFRECHWSRRWKPSVLKSNLRKFRSKTLGKVFLPFIVIDFYTNSWCFISIKFIKRLHETLSNREH